MSYFTKTKAILATTAVLSAQSAFAATINAEELASQYLPEGGTILAGTDITGTFSQPDGINGTFSYGARLGDDGSTMWQRSLEAFGPSQITTYGFSTTQSSLLTNVWENTRVVTPGYYVENTVQNPAAVEQFREQNFGTKILADGTVQLTMNTGIIAEGAGKTFVAVEGAEDFFVAQDQGGTSYGLFAQGLEPDTYTYVQEAEGGAYPVGTEIDPSELNFSENARVSVKIELEEGGEPQFTSAFAGIGFDMEPTGININLQPNNDVIDATQYHVKDVPDHIHIRISGRTDLDALQASLVSGDGFNIEASSTLGRRAETHTIVGEGDFAQDLGLTADVLRDGANFSFAPAHLVQRVLNYAPTATPLDSSVADSCETLGLDQLGLTANDVVLLPARVIAGTGVLPRESEAIVAVNPNDYTQVLAAAERHFVGQNMRADGEFHSTISRSAANDHGAIQFGGCTGSITQTGAPSNETSRTWIPPVIETTSGTSVIPQITTTDYFGSTTTTGGSTFTDTGTTPTPAVVPIQVAGAVLLASSLVVLSIAGVGASGNRRRQTSSASGPKPQGI